MSEIADRDAELDSMEREVESLKKRIQDQAELIDWAMRQVKECQVHFAMTGEGTTSLYETGRNVIRKHQMFLRQ